MVQFGKPLPQVLSVIVTMTSPKGNSTTGMRNGYSRYCFSKRFKFKKRICSRGLARTNCRGMDDFIKPSYSYNYDDTTADNKIVKAMASTKGWNSSKNAGAIGNEQSTNNSCGFNASPEGYHCSDCSFVREGAIFLF